MLVETAQPYYSAYIVIGILALLLLRSAYRSFKGRRYRPARVFRIPAVYALLTVILVLLDFSTQYYYYSVLLLIIAGYLVGVRVGTSVRFFYRGTVLYYRRSPGVYVIWAVSLFSRVILEFLMPGNSLAEVSVDSILSFTTGLLIGETVNIIKQKRVFDEKIGDTTQNSSSL
ncbi:hypothetical protein [Thermoplasma volcanium]|nr:hypothetical protein [Thermoplasma volcanium]